MGLRVEEICQFFNRFTAVTEAVLLFTGHLSKCSIMAFRDENRVIPEPSFPFWIPSYTTFDVSEEGLDCPVRECQSHATDELGASLVIRNIFEFEENFFIIFDIVPAAGASGVPRRIHSRCASQSFHFQTRIVGKGQLTCTSADFSGFLDRIALEGFLVLYRFRAFWKVFERENGDWKIGCDPLDLFDLFFVSRGQNNFHTFYSD